MIANTIGVVTALAGLSALALVAVFRLKLGIAVVLGGAAALGLALPV